MNICNAMERKPVVVGLGEVLWDLFPGGRKLGGASANFAWHANQLGATGIVVSSIGDDDLGHEILSALHLMGLDGGFIHRQASYPTVTVNVRVDSGGIPSYTIHERVAWDSIPFSPDLALLAQRADAVCVGSLAQRSAITSRTIQNFLDATPPACWRVFDLNLRQQFYSRETIELTLRKTRLLKLNDEEWPILADMFGLDAEVPGGMKKLMRLFDIEIVALTRGAEGSLIYSATETHTAKAPLVKVIDTVGAGDSFTAAFVMGILKGRPLTRAHAQAAKVASYVCTQQGATPEIPDELVDGI